MERSRINCDVAVHDTMTVLTAAGEIDAETRPVFEDLLNAAAASTPRLVVDLQAVTFLDSSGLHALLTARTRHPATVLVVRNPSSAVARVLDLTGTAGLFRDGVADPAPREGPTSI